MESALIIYLLLGGILVLNIYMLLRIRAIAYALEQPVVKKMSPQLKLKPVKINTGNQESSDSSGPGRRGREKNSSPRPSYKSSERSPSGSDNRNRDNRRRSGGGRTRSNNPRRDNPRNTKVYGNDAVEKPEQKKDRPVQPKTEIRDFGPPAEMPMHQSAQSSKQSAASDSGSSQNNPVSRRRPLAAKVSQESPAKQSRPPVKEQQRTEASSSPSSTSNSPVKDNTPALQHGRRTQVKKKPKFDIEDAGEKIPMKTPTYRS